MIDEIRRRFVPERLVPERLVFERDGYLASEAGMSFWCFEFL